MLLSLRMLFSGSRWAILRGSRVAKASSTKVKIAMTSRTEIQTRPESPKKPSQPASPSAPAIGKASPQVLSPAAKKPVNARQALRPEGVSVSFFASTISRSGFPSSISVCLRSLFLFKVLAAVSAAVSRA